MKSMVVTDDGQSGDFRWSEWWSNRILIGGGSVISVVVIVV
ncbi:hypothetical protein A2U01_0073552, partial [Trifolium medium]|nr:hypothetical protein [Trifolium medium]